MFKIKYLPKQFKGLKYYGQKLRFILFFKVQTIRIQKYYSNSLKQNKATYLIIKKINELEIYFIILIYFTQK